MGINYLVVDMQKLMDASQVGKDAATVLAARYEKLQKEHKALLAAVHTAAEWNRAELEAKARAFEEDALKTIRGEQDALRRALMRRAQPLVEEAMKQSGATLVLERGAVLVCDPAADITPQLIARVDQLGPLVP